MSSTRTVPRLGWTDLSDGLRHDIEAALDAPVVEWSSQEEGFSPGMAARCSLADGREVFIKALSGELVELSGRFYTHEIKVNGLLPAGAPAPTIQAVVETDQGAAIVFDHVAGRVPGAPWTNADVALVVDAIDRLDLPPSGQLADFREYLADDFHGWRNLRAMGNGDANVGIEPWLDASALKTVAEVEAEWMALCPPTALVHGDLRADNLLIGADSAVWFVDWAHSSNGPPWVDLAGLIPSVSMQGGPAPHETWAMSRFATEADPAAVDAFVTALAGYFTHEARKPPIPQIPMLRDFQEAQARPARAWMAQRLGV
jgi:aminoglycoside phosphotransferase (APT) family kinase protein